MWQPEGEDKRARINEVSKRSEKNADRLVEKMVQTKARVSKNSMLDLKNSCRPLLINDAIYQSAVALYSGKATLVRILQGKRKKKKKEKKRKYTNSSGNFYHTHYIPRTRYVGTSSSSAANTFFVFFFSRRNFGNAEDFVELQRKPCFFRDHDTFVVLRRTKETASEEIIM